ncbi:MAG: hypothetical protein ACRD1C_13055 [Terriglobales bacterium]
MGWRDWTVVAAAAAVVGACLWWAMPPAAVRQLPSGQTLVYVRMRRLRPFLTASNAYPLAPQYAAFVRASGFDFTRDLDAAAISLHGDPARPVDATAILDGEAGQALDGSRPPWQGLERVQARLGEGEGGLRFTLAAAAASPEAASAARKWLEAQVRTLRPLLDRLQTGQNGRSVWAQVSVDAALLGEWTRAIAAR